MRTTRLRRRCGWMGVVIALTATSGCQWEGVNSLPLPGTAGDGDGSFEIEAQLPDVTNIQRNSRVRVGDVTVGTVTSVERQGWHALIHIRLDGDVTLPANATAKVGQTSLLGSLHVELAPPADTAPKGRLSEGSVIPLESAGAYPTTEQTLAALAMLLNGGGIGQVQDITQALSTAFAGGRDDDLRNLIDQLDIFVTNLNGQTDDIIRASRSLDNLAGQFAAAKPTVDEALQTIPAALATLAGDRDKLVDALEGLAQFASLAADATAQTKAAVVAELKALGPVVESLANAGPALTRSLSLLATFPFPKETLGKWLRGDYANQTQVFDLTLNRIDTNFLTGTRFEGELTELEMQWGRTIGQVPSPYTAGNPLILPYHLNQGP